MKKISKLARKIDIAAKIFYKLCIAVVILCVLHLFIIPYFTIEDMVDVITIDSYKFELIPEAINDLGSYKLYLASMSIIAIVLFVYECFVIRIIRDILRPMTTESPFDMSVSRNIRKLSWTILVGEVFSSILYPVISFLEYNTFDFSTLFLNDKIVSCNIEYDFDVTFLVTFGIIYLLSYVFQYGEELQVQSDETL